MEAMQVYVNPKFLFVRTISKKNQFRFISAFVSIIFGLIKYPKLSAIKIWVQERIFLNHNIASGPNNISRGVYGYKLEFTAVHPHPPYDRKLPLYKWCLDFICLFTLFKHRTSSLSLYLHQVFLQDLQDVSGSPPCMFFNPLSNGESMFLSH